MKEVEEKHMKDENSEKQKHNEIEPTGKCPMRKFSLWVTRKEEGGKCPVHRSNPAYCDQLKVNPAQNENPEGSHSAQNGQPEAPHNINKCPVEKRKESEGGGCPVKGENKKDFFSTTAKKYKNPDVYNVYSQKIDPSNQMPSKPDQLVLPGQRISLSNERVQSNIPKAGTDSTWLYPSPQMFFNSLARKGKLGDMAEEDAEVVVAIHNNMNENTWRKILQWEELHRNDFEGREGAEPHLLRFLGRPDDLSPKAFLKTLLGYPQPFDRHDWIVDRGGKEVRYVIDYYHDEALGAEDRVPKLEDDSAVRSILVDVRPALDSVASLLDRVIRMPFARRLGHNPFKPLDFLPTQTMKGKHGDLPKVAAPLDQQAAFARIEGACRHIKESLASCQKLDNQDCSKQAIALTMCVANTIGPCKLKVDHFQDELVASSDEARLTMAFEEIQKCIDKNIKMNA